MQMFEVKIDLNGLFDNDADFQCMIKERLQSVLITAIEKEYKKDPVVRKYVKDVKNALIHRLPSAS